MSVLFEGSAWGAVCLIVSRVQVLAFTSDYEDLSDKLKNLCSRDLFQRSELLLMSLMKSAASAATINRWRWEDVSTYLSVGEGGKG